MVGPLVFLKSFHLLLVSCQPEMAVRPEFQTLHPQSNRRLLHRQMGRRSQTLPVHSWPDAHVPPAFTTRRSWPQSARDAWDLLQHRRQLREVQRPQAQWTSIPPHSLKASRRALQAGPLPLQVPVCQALLQPAQQRHLRLRGLPRPLQVPQRDHTDRRCPPTVLVHSEYRSN